MHADLQPQEEGQRACGWAMGRQAGPHEGMHACRDGKRCGWSAWEASRHPVRQLGTSLFRGSAHPVPPCHAERRC